MKIHKQQDGIAHLGIILLILLVISAIGFAVWRVHETGKAAKASEQKTATSATSTQQETKKTNATTNNNELTEKELIRVNILMKKGGEEIKLPKNTPTTFVEYMKQRLIKFEIDCSDPVVEQGVSVTKISKNFIGGSISCDGGASVLWYLKNGEWQEFGFQYGPDCSFVMDNSIPSEFMDTCIDSKMNDQISNPNGSIANQ